MKKSVLILAVLSLSISCSKVNKMEKNMDSMKAKIEQISSTTEEMKTTTVVIYQQAEDTRNKKFNILNSADEQIGSKIAAAAVYFKSFEFQLWSAQKDFDNKHARDVLILDAVNEFTKRISDVYGKINLKKMSPTNDGKKHNAEQAFYALAATMHMNHHYQDELIDSNAEVQAISFYDIVKSALRKDSDGEAMTDYEEVLLSGMNKEIMVELIKARVDMISALGLKNLTDKRNMTLSQKIKGALFKISGGKLGSIELPETFSKSNEPTKKQTIKYLEAANNAKEFLHYIGVDKELERTLKSAYSKISLGDDNQEQSETKDEAYTKKAQIRSLIDGLIQK